MDLEAILDPKSVFLDFAADGKDQALEEICSLAAGVLGLPAAPVYSAIRSRESLGSTALGGGLVVPHGKLAMIAGTHLFLARPAPGTRLDFGSPDGLPARLIALILSPSNPASEYLRLLALLGRLWNAPRNVSLLMDCPDQASFYQTFLFLSGSID
ncbi:MAG: PTS sugar transporter subunit IIA [Deltaproteobacteria bacterium]|jgi:PTS system nitrogen regulatory IIA component|nr:PTS sugar transporter subunit IIA [Deltaproteobacteria bacterium]